MSHDGRLRSRARPSSPHRHRGPTGQRLFHPHTLTLLDLYGVESTLSVPFERFPVLKDKIESRQHWRYLDEKRSYFESAWKPASWPATYRFIFVRRTVKRQTKEALQLDLFQPRSVGRWY